MRNLFQSHGELCLSHVLHLRNYLGRSKDVGVKNHLDTGIRNHLGASVFACLVVTESSDGLLTMRVTSAWSLLNGLVFHLHKIYNS